MKILLSVIVLLSPFAVQAESPPTPPSGRAIGFYIENDARAIGGPGSDQAYSNGFKFSYLHAENEIPKWAQSLLDRAQLLEKERQKSKANFGFSLGQQIYTPNDIGEAELISNDRPYAAWTYLAFSAHFKTPSHAHYWELSLGLVGPEALGEEVQNEFHRLIDVPAAQGWNNQIATEPTILMSYQQRLQFWEIFRGKSRIFDVIPFYGGSFGNVLVGAHGGGFVRLGFHIPDDLGPTRPSPTGGDIYVSPEPITGRLDWSFYGFMGGRIHGVGHSLFLDGNTFRSSHQVKKYPVVAETEFGFAGEMNDWHLIWRFVTKSPEFEEKSRFNSFATLNLSTTFR